MQKPNFGYLLVGVFIGLVSGFAVVLILVMIGAMDIFSNIPSIIDALKWIYINLRLTVVVFPIVLIFFFYFLKKLDQALNEQYPSVDRIGHLNSLVNIFISLFFGVGVIWTAVGMRDALIEAIGNLDEKKAAAMGAWKILSRLVEGGILMALSTTIVGGIGGYLMRLYKAVRVGRKLSKVMGGGSDHAERILTTLEEIRDSLVRMGPPAKVQSERAGEDV